MLDRINVNHFFTERAWDPDKKRTMNRYVRIKTTKLIPRSWQDQSVYMSYSKRRDRCDSLAMLLTKHLIRDMVHDMMYSNNRLVFPCNWKGMTFGWYKIGIFSEYRRYDMKDRLIMAIVPHEREAVGEWYPVISCPKGTWGFLERHQKTTTVTHDDINVQERLAAHLRLNGLSRRIYAPAKTKATHI